MFDLEKAIKTWISSLRKHKGFEEGHIEELENHLRDDIEHRVEKGAAEEDAFNSAVIEIGESNQLGEELYKNSKKSDVSVFKNLLFDLPLLPSYLKISLRSLYRQKGYAFINICGLALSMAACLLIFLYINDELSYDQYHTKKDRIYRIASDIEIPDQTLMFALTPPYMAPLLPEDISQVEHAVRISKLNALLSYREQRFQEEGLLYADKNLFEVFDFELLKGNPDQALINPNSIVLSESAARKYFGEEDPMGKSILDMGREQEYTITGVMKNIPSNSHFSTDFFISFSTFEPIMTQWDPGPWNWFRLGYYTYVLLQEGYTGAELEKDLVAFTERHISGAEEEMNQYYTFYAQPLKTIHFDSHLEGEIGDNGNITSIYIFSVISLLILLIALINFTNLATARSMKRAKEVGLRKTVGALRRQLALQFLGESIFISMLSLGIGVLIAYLMLPLFNSLADKSITFNWVLFQDYGLLLLSFGLIAGVLAGIYPAFIMSRFEPVTVLKGVFISTNQGNLLRKILVTFQYTVSIILIVGTIVIYNQLNYMSNYDLGFSKEEVILINFRGDEGIQRNYRTFKDELLKHSDVIDVTTSNRDLSMSASNWAVSYETMEGENQRAAISAYVIDLDFTDMYDIPVIAGRSLSYDFPGDTLGAFIVNRSTVELLGYPSPEDAIDKNFMQNGIRGRIIGVVENFNFEPLREEIEPLSMFFQSNNLSLFNIRVASDDYSRTLAELEAIWETLAPHRPFEYSFLNEGLDQRYKQETKAGEITYYFSILAVLIACLGLFGLAAFVAGQFKKEAGIRKILGASVNQIVTAFSKNFIALNIIAFVISIPVSWFAMEQWLQNFPYRTELNLWVFILAGALTVFFTAVTIAYQSVKTATMNPVSILRNE